MFLDKVARSLVGYGTITLLSEQKTQGLTTEIRCSSPSSTTNPRILRLPNQVKSILRELPQTRGQLEVRIPVVWYDRAIQR